jgi:hypothetical protein
MASSTPDAAKLSSETSDAARDGKENATTTVHKENIITHDSEEGRIVVKLVPLSDPPCIMPYTSIENSYTANIKVQIFSYYGVLIPERCSEQ